MEEIKLKPCPHCGDFAKFCEVSEGIDWGGRYIECLKCRATTPMMFVVKEPVDELLAERWNARWYPQQADEAVSILVACAAGQLQKSEAEAMLKDGIPINTQLDAHIVRALKLWEELRGPNPTDRSE